MPFHIYIVCVYRFVYLALGLLKHVVSCCHIWWKMGWYDVWGRPYLEQPSLCFLHIHHGFHTPCAHAYWSLALERSSGERQHLLTPIQAGKLSLSVSSHTEHFGLTLQLTPAFRAWHGQSFSRLLRHPLWCVYPYFQTTTALTHVSNAPFAGLPHFEFKLCVLSYHPVIRGYVLMRTCFGRPYGCGALFSLTKNGDIDLIMDLTLQMFIVPGRE